jgi:tRNA(Ile)-lysidine synthase
MCLTGYDYLDIAVITTERPDLLTLCPFPPLTGEFRLNIPGETFLPGWKITAQINVVSPPPYSVTEENNLVAHLDLHKTGTLLFVRKRQPGDRFQPLGMNVPKKLYRFMIDAKIPASWRDHIPVVFSPEHIVWVVGLRIDDRAKVTAETREILRLEFARWP